MGSKKNKNKKDKQWSGTDTKSNPRSCPKKQKERTKYINWQQLTKIMRGKPNEQLCPRQVVIQLPKLN